MCISGQCCSPECHSDNDRQKCKTLLKVEKKGKPFTPCGHCQCRAQYDGNMMDDSAALMHRLFMAWCGVLLGLLIALTWSR